ncbi:MAG: hypothetical protein ABW352_07855 [Polyangiales bacterium]
MSKRAWLAVLVLGACGDDEQTPEELQAQIERDCYALDVARCKQDDACSVITGRLVNGDPDCTFPPAELGCYAAEMICGEALSFASDPQGRTYTFGTTCIPAGFVRANSPPTSTASDGRCTEQRDLHEVCGELTVAACKQRTECQVTSARRVSAVDQCLEGAPVELGCRGATGVCGDASPVARDPQGQPWLFDDTCIPPTFTLPTREEMGAVDWSACK